MAKLRVDRLNSLLREVVTEVIRRDIHHNPLIDEKITITRVAITGDLHYAKVYISVMTDQEAYTEKVLNELKALSGFIGVIASKKVVMRYFPALDFIVDTSYEKEIRIEQLLQELARERESRESRDDSHKEE